MSRQVKISYCVLTRNSGKTLRQTLDSIKMQKLSKELIIVDTDSVDDTLEIAKEYNAKIFNEPKGNLATARNLGLENSKGKYLAFVDSDCLIFDNWDKRMVAYLREDNIAGVGCTWRSIGKDLGKWRSVGRSLVERAQDDITPRLKGLMDTNSIATMNAMYDRKRIGDTRFDEKFSGAGEDVDFNFQLRAKGFRLLLETNKHVVHHNPTTLDVLMKKYYHYGKWFLKPYMKHEKERDTNFELRRLYVATFAMNFVVGLLFAPWMMITILQLFVPFAAYWWITLEIGFAFIHTMKFYAHCLGIARGVFG